MSYPSFIRNLFRTRVLLTKDDGFGEVNYAEHLSEGRYVVVNHYNYSLDQAGALILNADGTIGVGAKIKDGYGDKRFIKWEKLK